MASIAANKIVVEAPISELDLAIKILFNARLMVDLANPDPVSIMAMLTASRDVQQMLETLRAGDRRLSKATPPMRTVSEVPKELEAAE